MNALENKEGQRSNDPQPELQVLEALSTCCLRVQLPVTNEKSVKVGRLFTPQWKVEASILPKTTTKLPSLPVSFDTNWRHLSGLRLADPEFDVPGNIDVLLGINMLNRVVYQGQTAKDLLVLPWH